MTLWQWYTNRETEYFTVSDTDGTVVYDARETDADVPIEFDDMIVYDVLYPDSTCLDVLIMSRPDMEYTLRTTKRTLSEYIELARKYGMEEFGQAVAEELAYMHTLSRALRDT